MHKSKRYFFGALLLLAAGAQAQPPVADAELSRGRYLVATSGCNDCHTAGRQGDDTVSRFHAEKSAARLIAQVRYSALILT
jgi:mono/diheme cytochrome c family protein